MLQREFGKVTSFVEQCIRTLCGYIRVLVYYIFVGKIATIRYDLEKSNGLCINMYLYSSLSSMGFLSSRNWNFEIWAPFTFQEPENALLDKKIYISLFENVLINDERRRYFLGSLYR